MSPVALRVLIWIVSILALLGNAVVLLVLLGMKYSFVVHYRRTLLFPAYAENRQEGNLAEWKGLLLFPHCQFLRTNSNYHISSSLLLLAPLYFDLWNIQGLSTQHCFSCSVIGAVMSRRMRWPWGHPLNVHTVASYRRDPPHFYSIFNTSQKRESTGLKLWSTSIYPHYISNIQGTKADCFSDISLVRVSALYFTRIYQRLNILIIFTC